jgi:L-erythro-3,5-diaminohexanoate dehydrogenase
LTAGTWTQGLGADRVLAPLGTLPQAAAKLDANRPVRPREFEVAVERLCLDATSFQNIRSACGRDRSRMAARVMDVVAERGKMHNPETDSGGVAIGTVTAIGSAREDAPPIGSRVVTLASLTLTPLHLDAVDWTDPTSAQFDVAGYAYVCERAPWAVLPPDLPVATALALLDVYAAGSLTRLLAPQRGTLCVMGLGHAGKLALAAGRDANEALTLVGVDINADAVEAAQRSGLCDLAVVADLKQPIATAEALTAAGVAPAELTVAVVSATGFEPAAILATRTDGTLLFFSMATNFQRAALTADGMSSTVRMLIGSGYTPDVGAYALDLYRRSPALRAALQASV